MELDVYVSSLQIADFGEPLRVGSFIKLELLGFWGGLLGPETQALEAFQTRVGQRSLRRMGITEYAFGGRILEARSLQNFGGPGIRYTETLVDCGLPIVLIAMGRVGPQAEDTEDNSRNAISEGRFLSGLMLLEARISFRYPQLITRELEAKITRIRTFDLVGRFGEIGSLHDPERIDSRESRLPVVLGVEVGESKA